MARRRAQWRQVHTFARLLDWLRMYIHDAPQPAPELLCRAARYPEFALLNLQNCRSFTQLPVPGCLPATLQTELHGELERLATAPRETACASLQAMAAQCHRAALELERDCRRAAQFYPQLGTCLGLLAALMLL